MTPTAMTPAAARGKKTKPTRAAEAAIRASGSAASQPAAPHRRTARPSTGPRRFSGPAGGVATTRRAPTPTRAPSRPRRRSGPARRGGRDRIQTPLPLPGRLAHFVRALPDHMLLDRVVRGRAWIPLLGILLAGIVAMQVETLKLSANVGRSLERGTAMQSRNEQLRASVAELSDDQRIERMAARMGMVMPAPAAVKFLPHTANGQLSRALANVHSPSPTAFAATLPGVQTSATAPTTVTGTTSAAAVIAPASAAPVTSPTTVPGVQSSLPTTSTSVPTTSTSVPTATSSVPTATSSVPTTSTPVPTTTSSGG